VLAIVFTPCWYGIEVAEIEMPDRNTSKYTARIGLQLASGTVGSRNCVGHSQIAVFIKRRAWHEIIQRVLGIGKVRGANFDATIDKRVRISEFAFSPRGTLWG
jgi:hypothetical protein